MNISYYTIDDLRLGHDPAGITGWRLRQYLSPEDAMMQYKDLPVTAEKSLGLTDGVHTLELMRCVAIFPDEREGVDVLASDYRASPLWAQSTQAAQAADLCISRFNLRYALSGNVIVPIPESDRLPKPLRDVYLWPDYKGDVQSAIRWVEVYGRGWMHPKILGEKAAVRPIVLNVKADGITGQGAYLALELKPWEYDLLARRTRERLDQNKHQEGEHRNE